MSQNVFQLDILTPEATVFSGKVASLILPAETGYMGILANHAPLITHVRKGGITIRDSASEMLRFTVKGDGFFEVSQNQAKLLVDAVETVVP